MSWGVSLPPLTSTMKGKPSGASRNRDFGPVACLISCDFLPLPSPADGVADQPVDSSLLHCGRNTPTLSNNPLKCKWTLASRVVVNAPVGYWGFPRTKKRGQTAGPGWLSTGIVPVKFSNLVIKPNISAGRIRSLLRGFTLKLALPFLSNSSLTFWTLRV